MAARTELVGNACRVAENHSLVNKVLLGTVKENAQDGGGYEDSDNRLRKR